jgi:hypothetical protein
MKLTDLQGDTKLKEMLNSVKHVSMFFTAVWFKTQKFYRLVEKCYQDLCSHTPKNKPLF